MRDGDAQGFGDSFGVAFVGLADGCADAAGADDVDALGTADEHACDVVRANDDHFAHLTRDFCEALTAFGDEPHLVDGAEVVGRRVEQT